MCPSTEQFSKTDDVDDLPRKPTSQTSSVRISDHQFAAVFRSFPYAVLISRARDGKLIEANDAFCRLVGVTRDEVLDNTTLALQLWVKSEDRQKVIQRLVEGETIEGEEYLFYNQANTRIITGLLYAERLDINGEDHILATIHEITEQKRIQEALLESERRYRTVADFNPDWTYWQKADGSLHYISPACETMTGYSMEQLIANPHLIEQMIVSEDRPLWDEHLNSSSTEYTDHTRQVQYRIQHTNGSIRWIEHNCRPVVTEDGIFDGYRVSNHDITERMLKEQELRRSRRMYQFLTDNVADVIWVLDIASGKFLYVSPSVERLRGYTPEEVMQQPVTQALMPYSLPAIERDLPMRVQAFLETGEDEAWVTHEVDQPCKDGSVVSTEVVTSIMRTPEGNLVVLGVSRNITKQKQERETALSEALEHERNKVLAQFIENASHEFRTPLAIISSSAYLMARTDSPQKRLARFEQIDEQTRRITRLLDMLLVMMRLENTDSLAHYPLNLREVVQAVCEEVRAVHGEEIPLELTLDNSHLTLLGEAEFLNQALRQVLDNAYLFSPNGGRVKVMAWRKAQDIWISVQDKGMGIAAEDLAVIFTSFWRKDYISTPGFGLGLPIAQRIVKLHGGDIEIKSQLNEGTTVFIRLPALNDDQHRQLTHSSSSIRHT